ncbi:MAG: DNA mismatch repair protein MutS [Thermoanaerobaculia bacterium]|nr:DNA mismatch repair protein MutS [Thermoanaerobaculia bacterium]
MARPGKNDKGEKTAAATPLMTQYNQVKAKYPDAILLFRVGDFYETFADDAVKTAKALGITLTSRNNGGSDVELAGFPHHAMDMYLPRLVRAGYRVAVCEQMEKPVPGKVVRRSVTEVVTPGVTTDDALLEHNQNNFLATLAYGKNDQFGAAFLDISTGEFLVTEGDHAAIDKLLQSFRPSEIVLPKSRMKEFTAVFGDKFYTFTLEDWIFTYDFGHEKLLQHFQTAGLKGFGVEDLELAQAAAGAALHYLAATENNRLAHIRSLSRLQTDKYVWLDRFTIHNLELVSSNHETGTSLLQVLDHTISPMGARLLKKWVLLPLTSLQQIHDRQEAVAFFVEHREFAEKLEPHIRHIGDLERLMSKTAVGKINPREVMQLRRALMAIDQVKKMLGPTPGPSPRGEGGLMASSAKPLDLDNSPSPNEDKPFIGGLMASSSGLSADNKMSAVIGNNPSDGSKPPSPRGEGPGVGLKRLGEALNPCHTLRERIEAVIAPDPPTDVRKGGAIADGAHPELDELRHIVRHSRELLLEIQQREAERTGIQSLKIGFNNVFGYYLEVTSKWKDQVPADWIRKQTIANGERYITPELKELESKILGAEEKILELEERIFRELVDETGAYIGPVQHNAQIIARLDCLLSFAKVAAQRHYHRPELDESFVIDIKDGRHPVIETQLPVGESYIPNDVYLDNETVQIILITGPNMAGKSALLRQTALIVLMAQMGSFVPAAGARIGLTDKVFTRVGASDNISGGESTFMVEMNETALIMNNISDRSLILLDEIGRGTSTYDGISIAWSLAEFLHDNGRARPKTLFATHYHELNELAEQHERIHNYHVSTREVGHRVIFLRKLVRGGSNHSFGIHVARMAGMPADIVERAREILQTLEAAGERLSEEGGRSTEDGGRNKIEGGEKVTAIETPVEMKKKVKNIAPKMQLNIFDVDEYTMKIRDELLALDLNTMTPMDALWKLNELRKIAEKK